ncbi:MAG: YicC family protein [Candidatus Manganitrophaceae bacterium]|nr:MAG: YicC family protein [Candidatus Manganitrophaceae bacterium]
MIRSMTGYGRAEGSYKGRPLVVELRSVNHRYCDVVVRLPKLLAPFEETLRKKVQERFSRGHIELSVNLNGAANAPKQFKLDLESAEAYYRILKKLKTSLHLSGEIDLTLLSHFKEIITVTETVEEAAPLARFAERMLERAMRALEKMRSEEGRALGKDLAGHLDELDRMLDLIKQQEKKAVQAYQERLQRRVAELTQGIALDPARLAQEVAVLVDRSDISEETARLKTHLEQFRKILQKVEAVGRTLEFLLQEMNREVNTIGSKANDVTISMQVVAMKGALEKIREQVQNIE